jgi:hypothetical protein
MPINEAAVLERARDLCKQDGFAWDLESSPGIVLSDEARQQYLERARAELGSDDA